MPQIPQILPQHPSVSKRIVLARIFLRNLIGIFFFAREFVVSNIFLGVCLVPPTAVSFFPIDAGY